MKKRTIPVISSILRHRTNTRTLLSKVEQLASCNRCLQEILPEPIRSQVQAVNLEAGALRIAAKSAVWANQLHYMTGDLLFRFQSQHKMEPVKSIQCVVLPTLFEIIGEKAYWEAAKLSAENAALLLAFSESITDQKLKQAMSSLARHKR